MNELYPKFVNPFENTNTNQQIDKTTPQMFNPNIPVNQLAPQSIMQQNIQPKISETNIDPKNLNLLLQQTNNQNNKYISLQDMLNNKSAVADNLKMDYYFGFNSQPKQNQEILNKLPSYAIYSSDPTKESEIFGLTQIQKNNKEDLQKLTELSRSISPNKPANSFQGIDISFIYDPKQLFTKIKTLITNPEFENNAMLGVDKNTGMPKIGTELVELFNQMNILNDPNINRDSPIAQQYFNQLKYKYYKAVEKMIAVLYAKYQDKITSSDFFKMLNEDKQKLSILETIYSKSGQDIHNYFKQKAENLKEPLYLYVNLEDKPSYTAKRELTSGKYAGIWQQFLSNLESVNDVGTQVLAKTLRSDLSKPYLSNLEKDAIRKYFSKYVSDIKQTYDALVNSGLSKTKAREYLGPLMDILDIENLIYMNALDDLFENAPIPKFNFGNINLSNILQATNKTSTDTQIMNTDLQQLPVYSNNNLFKYQIQPGTPRASEDATYASPSYTFLSRRR